MVLRLGEVCTWDARGAHEVRIGCALGVDRSVDSW